MPELPEVESLRLSLAPHLLGAVITRANLVRRDICKAFTAGGVPIRAAKQALAPHLLENGRVASLIRRGKQLAIITEDGRVLVIRLGMTGQVLITPIEPKQQSTHVHAMWILRSSAATSVQMAFRDPRRFGGLAAYPTLAALYEHAWNALGPDGLLVAADQLRERAGDSHRPIKAALLDQAVIAGVGNIYADEALFAAGINPHTPAANLTPKHWERLAAKIRAILTQAITLGGSTLKDYLNANGQAGTATKHHRVYGRGGQHCYVCGASLTQGTLAQRTTVWCPRCQQGEQ